MIVRHNLKASNSNRMLSQVFASQATSTERLSSGYRINRASDDAAGLAISEKMRKQIRGLSQASLNAQDGISAAQTAEGALSEVHDMLQRMNELAVKSANGTNSETDRDAIQSEIDQLTTEIDRVAQSTKFNEAYLLKGDTTAPLKDTINYGTFTNQGYNVLFDIPKNNLDLTVQTSFAATSEQMQEEQNELLLAIQKDGVTLTKTVSDIGVDSYSLQLPKSVSKKCQVTQTYAADHISYEIWGESGIRLMHLTSLRITPTAADKGTVTSAHFNVKEAKPSHYVEGKAKFYDKDGNGIPDNALDRYFTSDANGNVFARSNAPKIYDELGYETNIDRASYRISKKTAPLSLKLHVGADATANNQITMNLEAMTAKGLGINNLHVNGINSKQARNAIETIGEAIRKVSDQRSELGAVQNRLEHTIKNLDNVVENTTSAESQIRDTDMAYEMVKYSNNNILVQAGTSMLAQANQANQGVLSLLQ